ncbi:cobalamin biosynthesis protein CobU [Marmoricola endophyticus]|uniref:Adenosylcobinamide kinase n=1 Tax=Marmoricola endophyticus TaxID=2040280 RepID=A0A917BA98_9ACTN|nr:bifunctional adenosylcobinamide kinase/adenosylcobinamide-phosphate guanylyltransferase [Marmoricola endophyticus]GGF31919.1 cobalamin biosynthesis protein CobU [Marmoricola endophyticus]
MKVLVTGGVRSGKSAHAEGLLDGEENVTYVAPGDVPDPDHDPEWAARVAAHQLRRPASWATLETRDLAAVPSDGPLLLDSLGTWVTGVVDEAGLWDAPGSQVLEHVMALLDPFVAGVRARAGTVVLVSEEVGLGGVAEHRSGRLFADVIGTVNQRLAEVCDEVHLVVAGRVLRL